MGVKEVIWEGELPRNCWECYLKNLDNDTCHVTRKKVDKYYDGDSRHPDCPLVRALCERCGGTGWITTLDDSSIDGLGSMDCPYCGGRKVDIEYRDSILVEREVGNESAS